MELAASKQQLRRHVHYVVMAGDCPSVLLASEHVIPVLIEHKNFCKHIACVRQREHAEVEWVLRAPDRKILPKPHQ